MSYQAVIGLEVHVQLKTRTKVFCGCINGFGGEPNTQACPVCLGFPGSLPVLNKVALDFAIKVGLALNCSIQKFIKFDRKNYFYPDLPKNFQISQYDLPIAKKGYLDIELDDNFKRIGITRVHLEEDAGKLVHKETESLVDFNRAASPLLEIVSEPDINSPQEAYEYLLSLKSILEYLEVSDCDMEKGILRCDANVSVRKYTDEKLGTKAELKNMNSFKAVKEALGFEIKRQVEVLEKKEKVAQETRLWDPDKLKTFPMRSKEEAKDYRYFPEPDLPPFIINQEKLNEIKASIPELPRQKIKRLISDYGLTKYDSGLITANKFYADFVEEMVNLFPGENKKIVVNWCIGPLLSESKILNINPWELKIPGGKTELIKLILSVEEGKISNLVAKNVLSQSLKANKKASEIIQENGLFQISDSESLEAIISEVIKENAKSVSDYKNGKQNALMFLVGQVMKKSRGKANPKNVQDLLRRRLSA